MMKGGDEVLRTIAGLTMNAAMIATMAVVPTQAAMANQSAADTPATTQALFYTIRHVQSGRCLDGSVSQGVRLNTCNNSTYQQWGRTTNIFRHVRSGRCLDGSVSQGVRLNTCNNSTYQQWRFPGTATIGHVQSGRCLDGSVSQGVRLNTCNNSAYQEWIFRAV
jgi:pyocin large subunit-like protein